MVIQAESEAVLNTLTEYGFKGAFKMAEALGTVKGTTWIVMVASSPEISF
jgi:hypothetical protein